MGTVLPDERFKINDGVHRCKAALLAGLSGMLAEIKRDDEPPFLAVVELERIYSPKESFHRWDRRKDFFDLVGKMSSILGRSAIEPVILTPVSKTVAALLVPIADVEVLEEEGEDI